MAVYSAHFDFSIDDAEKALDYVNPNIDYKDWANIGRALAAEFGSQAEDIFHHWSSQSDNYQQSSVNNQWKSFLKSNGINISTLIYHARQAGWKPEKSESISDNEKLRRTLEREEKQKQRQLKAEKVSASKQRRTANFYSNLAELPFNKKPSPYQVDKHLDDAHQFSEYKEFHSHKRHLQVIPLRDIDNNWRGAELIYAWRKSKDRKSGKLRHFKRLLSGSEPSLGFHVFPNHEALKTAKRVFVTEGWADGGWSHKATGEVTAYVVGSHNVAVIAALIEQKYPDCQVIAATDNDAAGTTAIQKHNGYWTQPLALNDWSDVANQEGPESLKAQLLNIRGFRKCIVNEQYLGNSSAQILPGLNLIKSAKETGKSTWIIDFLQKQQDLSVLVISYRKNLVNQLAQKANVDYYEDLIVKGKNPNEFLRQSNHLAISPDSLYKLLNKGTLKQYDVVFIDECDQTLMHFDFESMQHKEKNLGVMSWLLKHSKYQLLADADLSEATTQYCNDIKLNTGQYVLNEHQPRKGSTMNLYQHHFQLRDDLITRAKQEPIFYCSNSKDRVLEVEQLLLQAGVENLKAVHSGNSSDKEIVDFIVDINNQVEELHVILASPSLGTGVSIDKGHPFKAVYAEFTHRSGTAEQAHQQMARPRGINEYNVFVDQTFNNFETDPAEIRRVMLDKPETDSENLFTFDINSGEMVAKDELFEKIYCRNKAFKNLNRNCFAVRFLDQAKAEGYEISTVKLNLDTAKQMKGVVEGIRARLEEELHERIFDDINHPILSDADFAAAELGNTQVSEESRIKTKVVRTLNLQNYLRFPSLLAPEKVHEFINELAFKEATSNYVSGIKKLSVLAQSNDIAVLRDIEDRKYAQSRANLKHFTAQRRHELRFLKAIGIDENLNYNGKEWQTKEIKNQMGQYLKKYKDEIQAYSGSTITDKTLQDPIRWFVNHLKAMNVPLVAYQKRVDGKQTWFRKVDETEWDLVNQLVNSRVRGLTKYYTEKQQEFTSVTVTREPSIYNDTSSSHVTADYPPIPVATPLTINFEKEGAQKDTVPAGTDDLNQFELFATALAEKKGATLKEVNKLFPENHKTAFIDGQLTPADMNKWVEETDKDTWGHFMAHTCMVIRKGYYQTLSAFNWSHVEKYNNLENKVNYTYKQLRALVNSKAETGIDHLQSEYETLKSELKEYREGLYKLAKESNLN